MIIDIPKSESMSLLQIEVSIAIKDGGRDSLQSSIET